MRVVGVLPDDLSGNYGGVVNMFDDQQGICSGIFEVQKPGRQYVPHPLENVIVSHPAYMGIFGHIFFNSPEPSF